MKKRTNNQKKGKTFHQYYDVHIKQDVFGKQIGWPRLLELGIKVYYVLTIFNKVKLYNFRKS